MRVPSILGFLLCATPLLASIQVTPSRTSFNPRLREAVTYTITVPEAGILSARILDRDAYVSRTLASAKKVSAGPIGLTWDGTDDQGNLVADEAWSLQVELVTPRGRTTYVPAAAPVRMITITPDFYDRNNGIVRYTLTVASRVHLQAGIADRGTTDRTAGAVMKTVVDRAPRPGGAIIEQWTGMDESGTIYVPALPNFVLAIAATPLPENAVITYGNRDRDFLSVALERTGSPLVHQHGEHAHHQGLSALDDAAPRLTVTPKNATWRQNEKRWVTTSRRIQFTLALNGATSARFKEQPARVTVYLDEHKVIDVMPGAAPLTINLPEGAADHVVAVNWSSDYGPVAATAFRLQYAR